MQPNDTVTINRGMVGVSIGSTNIAFIDGQEGRLLYRGHAIEDLAIAPCYEAVVHLLLFGTYPNGSDLADFKKLLATYRQLPDGFADVLATCRSSSPKVALQVGLSALEEPSDRRQAVDELALKMIGATASIICTHYALRCNKTVLPPDPNLDHATDFLRRIVRRSPSTLEADLINLDLVLHAEHGANASTTVARVVATTGASLCGATLAAMAALSGSKHGGASEAIAKMLAGIGSVAEARSVVRDHLTRQEALPGFGHRVYKTQDPRAVIYRAAVERWIESTGLKRPRTLDLVDGMIEEMAPYGRMAIAPNDDLLSVVLYEILEIPIDLITPLFAASRVVGWAAHYMESLESGYDPVPGLFYEERGAPKTA